ncbi:MAG TPA: ABC transporter permease [Puia sp.]|nr:ABC transporter permease [Puia sp.]
MLINYLRTALRNLRKNKLSSVINIFGLAIGLTSCLLIAVYIKHEVSYDAFEQKGSRIVRVIMEYNFAGSGESNKGNFTSVRVAKVFTHVFPEVESAVRMTEQSRIVGYKDKLIDEKNFMYADPTFFDIFTFPLLEGNPKTALSSPYSVVLTESAARKYFGSDDPLGRVLKISNDSNPYKITGVLPDCPTNSQIKFDFLASFSSLGLGEEYEKTYWDANYTTYLLLRNEQSIGSLQAKLPPFMKREMEGQGATVNFYLEPFEQIHLYSSYGGFEPNTNIVYIYILAGVALLILIIACATYVNLKTSRSIDRAREVGVRKVVGAGKYQLFWQFISESFVLCLVATLISLFLAWLLLPYFNQLSQKSLKPATLFSLPFVSFSLIIAVVVSLGAGSYPALVLSGFQPVKILKGTFRNSPSGQLLRKSLIVFQFAISVFLIVCTIIMQKQLHLIQHKDLGYDREHVIVLPMDQEMLSKLDFIKEQLKLNPDILNVSRCVRSPVEGAGGYNMRSTSMPENQQIAVFANPADEDYIATAGLHLLAGTSFTHLDVIDASPTDSKNRFYHFVLNETAAKQLGWTPEEALGKKMFLDNSRPGYVRGVVRDFNFQSLHDPVRAYVLFPEMRGREMLVRISGRSVQQTLAFIESKWKSLVPSRPFEYHFMDNDYESLYNAEIRLGSVMNLFASIAIVLACLGLFGLSAYAAQQRVKEIGIRKVLGASVVDIVIALSYDFFRLTTIAIVIGFPFAWWAMSGWLRDFAYRTGIGWVAFAVAGSFTLILAMVTVCAHGVRAALANPVKSLRSD